MQTNRKRARGFTFIELMVAMALTLIVLAAALMVFTKSMTAAATTTQRAEMQANARVAVNEIANDLTEAGAGPLQFGGIPLTSGTAPLFGTDLTGTNYLAPGAFVAGATGQFTLNYVISGYQQGPTVDGVRTDAITIVYVDPYLSFDPASNWSSAATTNITAPGVNPVVVTFPTTIPNPAPPPATLPFALAPSVLDAAHGLRAGDVVLVSNLNGQAVGVVTKLDSATSFEMADGDALGFNNSAAASGNVGALGPGGVYPAANIYRLYVVTYFIQPLDVNGNPLGPAAVPPTAVDYRLMRKVNALPPVPIAEHVVNLKFAYDIADAANPNSDVANPITVVGGAPVPANSEIRNVDVSVTARSPRTDARGNYYYSTMFTNVSPQDLSFQNTFSNTLPAD